MDISHIKVWLLEATSDSRLPFDPQHPQPDCLCLPVSSTENLPKRIDTLRNTHPSLPIFLICEPISKAYNVAVFAKAAKCAPDGIILRGVESAANIQMAETILRVVEARQERTDGSTAIIAIIGDNGAGLLNAGQFIHKPRRLLALGYDANPFCSPATHSNEEMMHYGVVKTLLAAHNLGIPAIDFSGTQSTANDFENSCHRAACDGFAGKLAAHPSHIGIIKNAFGVI